MIKPQWTVAELIAWGASETQCTCLNCSPPDVIRAKQVVIDLLEREEPEPGAGEAWPSETLGLVVLIVDGTLKKLTVDQARDLAAAMFIAADKAAAELERP